MDGEGVGRPETSICVNLAIPSSKVINVHAIADRVYRVLRHSLTVDEFDILRFESDAVDSCICGNTIVILLSTGKLVIPTAETIRDPFHESVLVEAYGVPRFAESYRVAQGISANPEGTRLAISLGSGAVMVLAYDQDSGLTPIKTIRVHPSMHSFQITGTHRCYLWTMNMIHFNLVNVNLELYEVTALDSKSVSERPITSFPITWGVERKPKAGIHVFGDLDDDVLVRVGDLSYFVPLKSTIVGDFGALLEPFSSGPGYYTGVVTAKGEYRLCFARSEKELVLASSLIPSTRRQVSSLQATLGDISTIGEELAKTTLEAQKPYSIHQCVLDSRKHPWRAILLGDTNVTALISANTVHYHGKSQLKDISSHSTLHYEPSMKVLFVSTPHGTGWMSENPVDFENLREKSLLAAGVVEKHTLFLVFPDSIDARSVFSPHRVISTVQFEDIILDAIVTPAYCIVRFYDRVVAIDMNLKQHILISGFATSFVSFSEDHVHIGLHLNSRSSELISSDDSHDGKFLLSKNSTIRGATLSFSSTSLNMLATRYHEYVPTDFTVFGRTHSSEAAIYGVEGIVALFDRASDSVRLIDVGSPLQSAGVITGPEKCVQALILYGRGLWVVSESECKPLNDTKGKISGQYIQAAVVSGDDSVAYISEEGLRFAGVSLSWVKRRPMTIGSVSFPHTPNLKLLSIPSKRILVLYGQNVCNFMDSFTFEPLLVSGLKASSCDTVALWQFSQDGDTFEHIVFADGRGGIESYTLNRRGREVELYCKFRILAVEDNNGPLMWGREHLACDGDAIFLSRGREVYKLIPKENKREGVKHLTSDVVAISIAGHFLIISTAEALYIISVHTFQVIRRYDSVDMHGKGGEVVAHAAHIFSSPWNQLYVVCAFERTQFVVVTVPLNPNLQDLLEPHEQEPKVIKVPMELRRRYDCVVRSFTQVPDLPGDGFRLLAVSRGYDILSIEIEPPSRRNGNGSVVKFLV